MRYFTIEELTRSSTAKRKGIDNTPTDEVRKNLTALIENVLDPIRTSWGRPIIVTSGYRCPKLNRAVGGSSTSQHMTGEAADIRTVEDTVSMNRTLFELITSMGLDYDQCIDEYGYNWIHVSYRRNGGNRHRILHLK